MLPDPHDFDLSRLRAEANFGRLLYFDEVGSTQEEARRAVREQEPRERLLVLARNQTLGRGRGENRWHAGPGALTFTWVLPAEELGIPAAEQPSASLAAALGVVRLIEELGPTSEFGLKWPNDVYLGGRKLCGVLAERSGGRLLLGVGVNINNRFDTAPPEVAREAVSLAEAIGRPFDLTETLLAVLERIARELEQLAAADPEQASAWNEYSLLKNRRLTVVSARGPVEGRCREISADGALHLETPTGPQRIFSGVVQQIEPPLAG